MAEGLSFMALKGKVDLQHPQLEIVLCEQHTRDATKKELKDFRRTLKRVFVGRKVRSRDCGLLPFRLLTL